MQNKILIFFGETKAELKKVNWPTKKQTIRYTLIIIGFSLAMALFLAGLDYFFGLGLKRIIQ